MSIELIQKYYTEVDKVTRLMARKDKGEIEIDTQTTLRGVPSEAWEYRLGTYSALEWILERYKEKKLKDPTIAEKFNTYRFADYKEQVIDLLMKVCTVSVGTMKIVKEMPE
jgi:predicted helicase